MTTYKYTDSGHLVVHIIDSDGVSRGSMLTSALPEGVEILPPDPLPVVIPDSCTPAQGLIALYVVNGITEADLQAAINAISDPVQKYTAQIGFSRATEWRRDSATVQALAGLLSLTEADLNALFTYAVTVQV